MLVAGAALLIFGAQKKLPLHMFIPAGTSQVLAKACTSLALANALSFPVVTLAKSGKMVPVMIGSIILGGTKYTMKEYMSVAPSSWVQSLLLWTARRVAKVVDLTRCGV